ncbi:MAG TPA: indole-3-glycerol phosphate synthase TrpC [Candidatus Hydrogenedentes bacterium]|nr:indole-3-glycerol phosphate synthase TrpC [Candidatus Hydrogenedentota bacterium]HOT50385.1 indole-3-glycerol phosphate synthase TrpC [Candidatus Hydrogenedentota bacterium]HOV75593.1 indole-3-glycerol phosphate synthase TrpC [Candidatus Hydrogenedentota bacterium]HPC17316.1 indole-3-glycerol phosphate synthase TrpC [Candidatus Hydrogenedentota bacterium]HRT20411.1 indole-3-glycerol phosphate synthase TrpC [Candidatus Hydrogenedentota bacterium]
MVLDAICANKRAEVERAKTEASLSRLVEAMSSIEPPRGFHAALRCPGMSLIAEIKRKSPSKGVMAAGANPVELAGLYERFGARAISVLTDTQYFDGSLEDLSNVRRNVKIPCLRKDFVLDEYQVYEARAHGADAILLIVRILSDAQLKDYLALAHELGMDALVETHDEAEMDRAVAAGAHIIGINNRDLDTLAIDLETTLRLKRVAPAGLALVSESGIHTRDHVRMLEDAGVDAILVGEALMTSPDIAAKIRELLGNDAD